MGREAPIYVQTHDMLLWLVPHLEGWPRPQRFLAGPESGAGDSTTAFYATCCGPAK